MTSISGVRTVPFTLLVLLGLILNTLLISLMFLGG